MRCCATCDFFKAPKTVPENFDASRDTAGVYSKGDCRRFPKVERKAPDDFCGEFSPRKDEG